MNHEDEARMANLAFQFLQRTQLQGNEVPTFTMVMQWLGEKANKPLPEPKPEPETKEIQDA